MTINISLISNLRRITNCVKVIGSVLDNSVKPDRVYLTLSHKDFPKYEQDIPSDLYKLVMTSNKVILNLIKGKCDMSSAIKSISSYLQSDDIIIPIDGVISKNYIQTFMEKNKKFSDSAIKVKVHEKQKSKHVKQKVVKKPTNNIWERFLFH